MTCRVMGRTAAHLVSARSAAAWLSRAAFLRWRSTSALVFCASTSSCCSRATSCVRRFRSDTYSASFSADPCRCAALCNYCMPGPLTPGCPTTQCMCILSRNQEHLRTFCSTCSCAASLCFSMLRPSTMWFSRCSAAVSSAFSFSRKLTRASNWRALSRWAPSSASRLLCRCCSSTTRTWGFHTSIVSVHSIQ